jgi:hypothetical protein
MTAIKTVQEIDGLSVQLAFSFALTCFVLSFAFVGWLVLVTDWIWNYGRMHFLATELVQLVLALRQLDFCEFMVNFLPGACFLFSFKELRRFTFIDWGRMLGMVHFVCAAGSLQFCDSLILSIFEAVL